LTLPLLYTSTSIPPADRQRCVDFVDFLDRRARLEPGEMPDGGTVPDRGSVVAALLRLGDRGLLSYALSSDGTVEVFYTPSQQASHSVLTSGTGSGFPEPVQKKQEAAFRAASGALFRFPVETGEGALEVFITDWSPCPAACAVAIHRSHPFAADVDKPPGAGFTGRYVRHPLTGDLLPVWVADWVRPDFGTGAVLVNPAHDPTDLAFARATGLPIRFALVPPGYDGSPATWPDPPVVKTGQTVRTGPYDGLPAEAAVDRYFAVLAERGLAERHRDVQAGRWRIGRLVPDPVPDSVPDSKGDLAWSPSRCTVLPAGLAAAGTLTVGLVDAGLLTAAVAPGVSPVLVCPASEQTGDVLGLRLLAYDLTGRAFAPAAVFVIQKVQETKVEATPEVVRLAAFLGSPIQQVAVVKQQIVEQVQRFLRVHQELLGLAAEAGAPGEPEEASRRAFAKVKAAVREGDPAKAFSLLLQTQKQVRDLSPGGRAGALPAYFVLAGVVTGLAPPDGLDGVQVWGRM